MKNPSFHLFFLFCRALAWCCPLEILISSFVLPANEGEYTKSSSVLRKGRDIFKKKSENRKKEGWERI
jgi:hypothetical protein